MTNVVVERGASADLGQVTDLLNEIIAAGGTTALTNKVTRKEIAEWLDLPQGQSTWHVAQTADGEILGFQWIGDWEDLPPEACEIGTFVKIGKTGLGVGSKMFAKGCPRDGV